MERDITVTLRFLEFRGFKGFYAEDREEAKAKIHNELVRESTLCDVFLTGTNAVTLDGRLVNVDARGKGQQSCWHILWAPNVHSRRGQK